MRFRGYHLYDNIEIRGVEMNTTWIKIEEGGEMPEKPEDVLILIGRKRRVGYLNVHRSPPLWVVFQAVHGATYVYSDNEDQVTHWQPLPNPPPEDTE